jgi:HYR domain
MRSFLLSTLFLSSSSFFLFAQTNCDTTIDYTLQFCKGTSIVVNNSVFNEPGLVIYSTENTNGCDTIFRVTLVYSPLPKDTIDIALPPNGSVSINQKIYDQPQDVVDTIFSADNCDSLVLYRIRRVYSVVPDTCTYPGYFLKIYGDPLLSEQGNAIAPTADGGFYTGSAYRVGIGTPLWGKPIISRFDRFGNLLWSRLFSPTGGLNFTNGSIGQILVDSEQKLIGTLHGLTNTNEVNGAIFRYDPQTNTMLWVRFLNSGNQIIRGIKEIGPNNNFVIYTNPKLSTGVLRSEIWEVNRQTGAVIGSLSDFYETGTSFTIGDMVISGDASPFSIPGDTMQIRPMLAKIDRLSGQVIWAERVNLLVPGTDTSGMVAAYRDLVLDNGVLVALQGTSQEYSDLDSSDFSLQFFDTNGNVIRSKGYSIGDAFRAQATDIEVLTDGYLIYGASVHGSSFSYLLKIDKTGTFLWAKRIVTSSGTLNTERIAVQGESAYITGATDALFSDILTLKTDNDGYIDEYCQQYFQEFEVATFDINLTLLQTGVDVIDFVRFAPSVGLTASTINLKEFPICVKCSPPPCFDVFSAQTIRFCPDETVVIGGSAYSLPGIVKDTIALSNGCDSIIVYSLEYVTSPEPIQFSLDCPSNIVVSVPSNSTSAVVNFTEPLLNSNCPCPDSDVSLWQGISSGSAFPLGISNITYVGSDDCGNTGTCSFSVEIRQEKPCDTKISGCIKYELLSVDTATTGFTYTFRVTNNCSGEMDYSRFQLAGGIALDMPNESEYMAPSGRKYLVRNPHFSHIRFKTIGQGIKNGESDIFVYKLSPSANIAFINVGTKLKSGEQFESYIINFGCESQDGAKQREAIPQSNMVAVSEAPLRLSPNPAQDRVAIQFDCGAAYKARFSAIDGRLLKEIPCTEDNVQFLIPNHWPSGVYAVECIGENGTRATSRLVIGSR